MYSILGLILLALAPAEGVEGQGLEGFVYRISGNQMPSPDSKPAKPKGIRTVLYIYALTSLAETDRQGQTAYFTSIHTKLICRVKTDSTGHFNLLLPAGQYSLFGKKGALFYANWFDQNNHIAPVEVLPGKITKTEFKLDYDAVY